MTSTRLHVYTFIVTIVVLVLVIVMTFRLWRSPEHIPTEGISIEDYFKPGIDHNTIYFRAYDDIGVESYIHDSGVDPRHLERFDLNIVKKEYNEGNIRTLNIPRVIKYGQQITDLKHEYLVSPDQVKDKGLFYVVTVNTN